jgi:3-hydroxyisobutyrate dehydrogenase-like beta-hydroxyacid dehydrogenase
MGRPMAENLLAPGFNVVAYNRTRRTCEEFVRKSKKATYAASPKEVAERSEVIFISLPSPDIVTQVVLGKDGLIEGLRKGCTVIDTSTIDPQTARNLATALSRVGVSFLDAPVSGGPERAKQGTLTFMVGGDKNVFKKCRKIFRAMGKNLFYMGKSGAGQGTKLVNQILTIGSLLFTAEAMSFGAALDLDLKKVVEVIQTSAGDSFMFRRSAPRMLSRDFGRGWQTYLMLKDSGLILKTATNAKLPVLLSATAHELLSATKAFGYDKEDPACVVTVFEKLGVHPISKQR